MRQPLNIHNRGIYANEAKEEEEEEEEEVGTTLQFLLQICRRILKLELRTHLHGLRPLPIAQGPIQRACI